MASQQATDEKRQKTDTPPGATERPQQTDPGHIGTQEQGLRRKQLPESFASHGEGPRAKEARAHTLGGMEQLREESAPTIATSAGRQQAEVGESDEDARARFQEHRAQKRRGGKPQAPLSPRRGPSLSEELHKEFAKRGEDSVTIGEALEAAGHARGDKPVDASDASAIQSAVARATSGVQISSDLAAEAEKAATENERKLIFETDGTVTYEGTPHRLGEVLKDAARRLPMDKPATGEDARRVQSAEQRNDPFHVSHARGIAAHMQAAAAFNEAAERVAAHEPRYPHGYKPALDDPVLIGEALEVAGHARADKPVDPGDARAAQAAVTRATGDRTGGPLGAEAQLLAALNLRDEQVRERRERAAAQAAHEMELGHVPPQPARETRPGSPRKGAARAPEAHTLGQLLQASGARVLAVIFFPLAQHASEALSADKVVTREDARKVTRAEARGDPEHHNVRRGVAAQMQAAARLNEPQ
ncbi:hypothetical protein KFL_000560240 [Klebsormidium nitens]|uniref:SMP domain-containing protein n=1 Tax=Klebsormidium nitens TaxID=105231 RepID=A0A1Y1HPG6_KLENI|nr:hypothetical protein KFL_000560240 [Klebsormidium nitens]|eukprot:GAQ80534.1 hypothetical protein KFL_000560240 [Klebsormidium nitens]